MIGTSVVPINLTLTGKTYIKLSSPWIFKNLKRCINETQSMEISNVQKEFYQILIKKSPDEREVSEV